MKMEMTKWARPSVLEKMRDRKEIRGGRKEGRRWRTEENGGWTASRALDGRVI